VLGVAWLCGAPARLAMLQHTSTAPWSTSSVPAASPTACRQEAAHTASAAPAPRRSVSYAVPMYARWTHRSAMSANSENAEVAEPGEVAA